jgi:hypothetical protein
MTNGKDDPGADSSRALQRWEESGVALSTVGMARAMVQSGYFTNVTNVAQAIVKIEMGKELGISPVEAMQYLHIFTTGGDRTNIQLGYPLVGALIQRSGKYHFTVQTRTEQECEIDFYRILASGEMKKLGASRFTLEKAKRAGLVTKDVWKSYPEVMLYARALTHGAKAYCPEILGGAGVKADEPYIEGMARRIDDDPAPTLIEEPPEGFTEAWPRFWAVAKGEPPNGLGMTEEQVHAFFGVDSLKESATRIVASTGKTEAEVVAEFEMALREGHAPPDDGQQPEPEAVGEKFDNEQAEAGMAQGSEPADEGLV